MLEDACVPEDTASPVCSLTIGLSVHCLLGTSSEEKMKVSSEREREMKAARCNFFPGSLFLPSRVCCTFLGLWTVTVVRELFYVGFELRGFVTRIKNLIHIRRIMN